MAGTLQWYGLGLLHVASGDIDLSAGTFYAMLTTSGYTPDLDVDEFRSDVTNETSGTGYDAGGKALAGLSLTYDAVGGAVRVTWDDPVWPGATFTCRSGVIYHYRGGPASADELIAVVTNDVDLSPVAAPFTLDLNNVETLKISRA